MPRFAKLVEEELKRRKELKHKDEKNYQSETFFLYVLIKFHTWDDSGICKTPIREIIENWKLDYNNSMRRYKFLRTKKWIEIIRRKDGDWIRPLIALKTVNSTVEDDNKTVNSTVEKGSKTVNSTVNDCKLYSKKGSKTVNSTVAFKGIIEPLKNVDFSSEPSETKIVSDTTTANSSNGHQSQFSREEIIRYLDIRTSRGERIETPHKLAQWMYQTGDYDAFIKATLYPEPIEQTIVYDDGEAPIGDDVPQWLPESVLSAHLYEFKLMSDDEFVEYQKHYTEDNWSWLVEHRK